LESLETRNLLDSTVVFNEIMYNPAGDGTPEWIELHNQMAVNVDISNWKLSGGADFTFASGTVVPGGGYVVVAADPAALQMHTGFAGARGPFVGSLDNGGERLELINHAGRIMDRIDYGDDNKWPVGPDGSGATLAKFNSQSGSEDPASWSASVQMGGSPGGPNVPPPVTTTEAEIMPMSQVWRYNQTQNLTGVPWQQAGYNDTAWPSGGALLYVENAVMPAPKVTPLTLGRITYYFRTKFNFDGNLGGAELRMRHIIDDGAIIYLNGQEAARVGMAPGAFNYDTLATAGISDAGLSGYVPLPTNMLVTGENTLAVEVHQNTVGSSDIVFGMELVLQTTTINPGVGTPTIGLNEISGALDAGFSVELRNNGTAAEDLAGYVVGATGLSGGEFVLPAQSIPAGGYVAITQAQLGFRPAEGERLFVYQPGKTRVIDAATVRDNARGRTPDGSGRWQFTSTDTFGAANSFSFRDEIVINEIMYHDKSTYAKPAKYSSAILVPYTGEWKYHQSGDLHQSNMINLCSAAGSEAECWRSTAYDDTVAGWATGGGLLYNETPTAVLPAPRTTLLTLGKPTYYFRTTFDLAGDPSSAVLQLRHIIDDAAVFYINGTEFSRYNFAASTNVTYSTLAGTSVGDAVIVGPVPIPSNLLVSGTNVLAVEVHQINAASNDVVFGAEVSGLTVVDPGSPYVESNEEWIELYNRSDHAVDLTGWRFDDAIHYDFPPGTTIDPGQYLVVANDPAALVAKFPGITAIGPFTDVLNNVSDRIVLEDPTGNIADEVEYFEGGRWPEPADGGGRSLELKNPLADNSKAEAWAASNEEPRSSWQHYEYTAIAVAPVYDPVPAASGAFPELRVGLLDAGEVLFDNFSVLENPGGTNTQLVQNGTFDADAVGGGANKWRLLGTHANTHVASDPNNAGNKVLHIVATGKADYLDNLLETTTVGSAAIVPGRNYRISFDAKWLSGSPQLRAELYYNRVVTLEILQQPSLVGTPGTQNSTYVPNIGPTYQDFRHGPAVPSASQPATVTVAAADPDGVASMTLFYSVAGGAWQTVAMTAAAGGQYTANIPGQASGAIVQFYVRGQDTLGAVSMYPAEGPASRALIKWNDGQAQVGVRHNFRMVMTQADVNKMFLATNMMSNERLGATVVYDESEVFYDVGIRQRGSMFSRGNPGSTGYNIKFQPDHLFRGVHSSVTMKAAGRAEILVKHTALQVGIPEMYDDVVYMNTPSPGTSSIANMSMARYGDEFITTQYEDGGEGTVFKMQGVRVLLNNTGLESLKTYQPVGWLANYDLTNLGDDYEQYRWSIQIMNNRAKDDYGPLVAAMKALSLNGVQLEQAVDDVIDVDQWMRVFALQSLWGIGDAYMQGNPHNIDFFVPPDGGKVLVLPWDWNFVASYGATSQLYGIENKNVTEVIDRPIYRRLYFGHMRDMIQTFYNPTYMNAWTTHYGTITGESYANQANYIVTRGNHVMSEINRLAPAVPFNITTPNGQQVGDVFATITGDGWIDVREIKVDGNSAPLSVTWTDFDSWRVNVPVNAGLQTLTFRAYNHQGVQVGSDTITIESTVSGRPIQDYLRVTELMYHPSEPTPDEVTDGFVEADSFEYIELHNIGSETLDLTGVKFTDAIEFDFTGSGVTSLAPGGYVLVVEDAAAFASRYGSQVPVAGEYTGRLNNAGEHVRLEDSLGVPVLDFTYDDTGTGWQPTTDGLGDSLVITNVALPTASWDTPAGWRASFEPGGSPGRSDMPTGDFNLDGRVDLGDVSFIQSQLGTSVGATRETGDLSGDGAVTRDDVARLLAKFGVGPTFPLSPAASPVIAQVVQTHATLIQDRAGENSESSVSAIRLRASRRPTTQPRLTRAIDQIMSEGEYDRLISSAEKRPSTGSSSGRLTSNQRQRSS
jgi:hypothetical protein